ncbi:MAG: RHS repeat-associated core domain-containing protein, partial [Anaerolineae bacterium]|nr:RHS repeat-associated core domain-containing protein [Anaerolineae bacterium]
EYDLADNLIHVTTPQGAVSYIYNGDNNRVARIDGDQQTDYLLSYGNILAHTLIERDSTGTRRYVVGNERLYHINPDDSVNFYLQDGQGSIVGILTPNIGMTQKYRYHVHGKPVGDVSGEIFAYTGESYDAIAGLIYLRARYYDPDTARFINQDPLSGVVTIPTTQNGYSYAENNPVNMIDPTGEFFWFLIPLAIMVVKAVATSVVAGAVIGGIVEAANGGNFFEGMGRGIVDAFKDPLSYIPLPGIKNLYSVARYGFKVAASVSKLAKAIKVYKGAQAAGRSIAASSRITAKSVFMTPYWSRIKGHRVLRLGVGEDLLMGLGIRGALYPFRGDIRAGINSATQWIADGVLGGGGYTRSVLDTQTGQVLSYYNNPDGQLVDYGQFALWDANGIAGLVGNPTQCIAAPASQVLVGDTITTIIPNLQIRAEPSMIAPSLGALAPNTTLSVLDGPVCGLGNGQYVWWLVDINGTVGWVAEGDSYYGTTPRYFVAPPALAPASVNTGLNCPKAPPQFLQVNDSAVINTEGDLVVRLRNRPGGAFLEELTDNTPITIINGPSCNEFGTDYRWWQVRTDTGAVGWIADGDMTVEPILYFALPQALQGMERGRTPVELGCPRSPVTILQLGDVAIALEGLRLRQSPGGDVIREMSEGTRFEIVGGPTCNGEFSWWQVRTVDDTVGWVAEGDITRYQRRYFINLANRDSSIDNLGFEISNSCGSALISRLERDMIVTITPNVSTTHPLLTSPFTQGTEIRGLDVGEFVVVVDGPVCGENNQLAHWLVRTSAGEYGWVVESNSNLGDNAYFLEPYANR